MNDHEVERIAACMNMLRPDWPKQQLKTLLKDDRITDRPRRDVCVALAWIASEPASHTPYRVLEAGPWWRAAGVEGSGVVRNNVDPGQRCSVCSQHHDKCRRMWADDHEFESAVDAAQRKAAGEPDALKGAVAALKAEVAATPEREDAPHGLEDLADRKPELRARVDRLRAEVPGLQAPPMQEPTEPEESA